MTIHFAADVLSMAIGYVIAVFTPAITKEIKSWFVATATTVEADLKKL